MTTKQRYLIAFAVMLIGFLPMGYTACFTSNYIPLVDYLCAMLGFLLAVHITEVKVGIG
jgi:cytochrome bd-type quinol oxidase subunit 2